MQNDIKTTWRISWLACLHNFLKAVAKRYGIWTHDLCIVMPVQWQLSYQATWTLFLSWVRNITVNDKRMNMHSNTSFIILSLFVIYFYSFHFLSQLAFSAFYRIQLSLLLLLFNNYLFIFILSFFIVARSLQLADVSSQNARPAFIIAATSHLSVVNHSTSYFYPFMTSP